jgi:predicted dehydrogenase
MLNDIDGIGRESISRRDFLSVGAVSMAAGMGAAGWPLEAESTREGRAARSAGDVRIGVVGAGGNVRDVMIPAFRRAGGCEIVAVANRSLGSSQRAAAELGIPRAYANWRELLEDGEVDAVVIGTWPYTHRVLTLASLDAGKHVLCQARMANDATEARDMLAASLKRPDLVCQLVPTSTSYRIDNILRKLITEGAVGEVLSAEIQRVGRTFADFGGPLDWRHEREFSGLNTMHLGSTYESTMRWLGRGDHVMAMSSLHVPLRRAADGELRSVSIPNHLDILYRLASGTQVHMRISETTGLSEGNQTWIHGSDGTIYVDDAQSVYLGHRGDSVLSLVPNPPEGQGVRRVEEEFLAAIRGEEEVTMLPFEAGVHYMEWTEAVHRSSQSGRAVQLP